MNWHDLDAQGRRKAMILAALVGGALLLLISPASMQQRSPARRPVRQVPKPAPRKPVPVVVAAKTPGASLAPRASRTAAAAPALPAGGVPAAVPQTVAVPPARAPFAELLGVYQGQETLGNRGACRMRMELRRNPEKEDGFAAFTRLICTPPFQERAAESKASPTAAIDARDKAMNPTAAILKGLAVRGAIQLRADTNIGVRDARDGCEITALNVMPFGTRAIAVDWQETQEGLCRGGQMVMNKTR